MPPKELPLRDIHIPEAIPITLEGAYFILRHPRSLLSGIQH
jgi:hypothetical protein